MHFFIVPFLLGFAAAAPQGYNYQAQAPQQLHSPVQLPSIPQFASLAEQSLLQQALQAPQLQQVLSGGGVASSYSTSAQQQHAPVYQQQQQVAQPYHALPQPQQLPQQQQHLVSKDIYVHVPPAEEPEERYPQPVLPPAPPRKHYRIVFIKAPTPSVSKAALRIKQAPVEEKTIIYVLTKKPDPLDLQAAIEEAAPKQPSKPEVFFIKYKTQEEAAHAQRTIQAQYDQLGGTSQVSDEGVAPVTSVIGVLDHQRTNLAGGALANNYLPANLRT
ncbi:alpha/beta-gliadin MM1 [Drosophila ficusphila]|uniref:alpha/beta-gliadin MM1 n=1 Tax=Drosophila ficusphila TaxID=30025 RepID=UPI0007E5CB7E|nr:alpha/beta-gliadin MM1 [Drosophila ficusphila]